MYFIIILFILFIFAYILFKVFSTVNLELPESTLKIAGKIFKFYFNEEDSFKNPPSFIINNLF